MSSLHYRAALCLLISVFWSVFNSVHSKNVLMVSPQFRSHVLVQRSVGEALIKRGHRVFIALASRYPADDLKSFGDVKLLHFRYPTDELYAVSDEMERNLAELIFERRSDPFAEPSAVCELLHRECDLMMSDVEFLKRVQVEKIDLVVVDPFVLAPCMLILPAVLGVPWVSLTGFYFPWSIGLPALPSFFTLPGPRPAPDLSSSFLHRLGNTLGGYLAFRYVFFSLFDNTTVLQRHLPDVADWDVLLRRSEMFLMENDHWLDDPEPLFPNTVTVAGLTARPPKVLPPELAQLFDEASDQVGVILVSFGSTAYRIPRRHIRRLFDAFRQLNQTVIARFAVPADVAHDVPPNVKLVKWLPQNDVLGHNKTRLFVTHCGSHGQYEALFHGVPMLGLPMFAEQVWNCDRVRRKYFGLSMVDFFDDRRIDNENVSLALSTRLLGNIQELLNNRTYRDTIMRMSAAWRHAEPLIGSEKAAYWIDHVMTYGSEHLRPSSLDMPIYQFLMLDILAVFLASSLISLVIIVCVVRWLFKCVSYRFFSKQPQQQQLESKKQN